MPDKWGNEVKKRLIDLNMTRRELAARLDVNYSVLCAVINETLRRDAVKQKINAFLLGNRKE